MAITIRIANSDCLSSGQASGLHCNESIGIAKIYYTLERNAIAIDIFRVGYIISGRA